MGVIYSRFGLEEFETAVTVIVGSDVIPLTNPTILKATSQISVFPYPVYRVNIHSLYAKVWNDIRHDDQACMPSRLQPMNHLRLIQFIDFLLSPWRSSRWAESTRCRCKNIRKETLTVRTGVNYRYIWPTTSSKKPDE